MAIREYLRLFAALYYIKYLVCFRIYNETSSNNPNTYFLAYQAGFVGTYGDPSNYQRERINEGAFYTPTEAMFYEGVSPRQVCPGMVGPFTDGNYYCTAREFGYCDRRSGACFCNIGYEGIDCTSCSPSYFKVGTLCYPKKLCPNDCSFAGQCDYWTGKCYCDPYREGESCDILLCKRFNPLCELCTNTTCLSCMNGYYLTGSSNCSSCSDFDPRCAGCTLNDGCTLCADPLLTSIRRSGYRSIDPKLPFEENTRELNVYLPFGTKSTEAFANSETYEIFGSPNNPLKNHTIGCDQGLRNDDTWSCRKVPSSYVVCGHYGVFRFTYPNYVVSESSQYLRLTVVRSGGGVGNVSIGYYINYLTANASDASPTTHYTTSQTLYFNAGTLVRCIFFLACLNLPKKLCIFHNYLSHPTNKLSLLCAFEISSFPLPFSVASSFSFMVKRLYSIMVPIRGG